MTLRGVQTPYARRRATNRSDPHLGPGSRGPGSVLNSIEVVAA